MRLVFYVFRHDVRHVPSLRLACVKPVSSMCPVCVLLCVYSVSSLCPVCLWCLVAYGSSALFFSLSLQLLVLIVGVRFLPKHQQCTLLALWTPWRGLPKLCATWVYTNTSQDPVRKPCGTGFGIRNLLTRRPLLSRLVLLGRRLLLTRRFLLTRRPLLSRLVVLGRRLLLTSKQKAKPKLRYYTFLMEPSVNSWYYDSTGKDLHLGKNQNPGQKGQIPKKSSEFA